MSRGHALGALTDAIETAVATRYGDDLELANEVHRLELPVDDIAHCAAGALDYIGSFTAAAGLYVHLFAIADGEATSPRLAPTVDVDALPGPSSDASQTRPPAGGPASGPAATLPVPAPGASLADRRAEVLGEIVDLVIDHPSKLWHGWRAPYLRRHHVDRLDELPVDVLDGVATAARTFAAGLAQRKDS